MDEEQHKQIIEEVRNQVVISIKETVNGKIDQALKIAKASAETAYHVSLENIRMNKELKVQITEIGDTLAPIAEIYTDLTGTKKVLKWVFYVLSLLIGFILSLRTLLK